MKSHVGPINGFLKRSSAKSSLTQLYKLYLKKNKHIGYAKGKMKA